MAMWHVWIMYHHLYYDIFKFYLLHCTDTWPKNVQYSVTALRSYAIFTTKNRNSAFESSDTQRVKFIEYNLFFYFRNPTPVQMY